MTKFNPENKETLTYGEILGTAMSITDESDAQQYLKDYADFIQKHLDKEPNPNGMSAMEIAKTNLGYFAGYYDDATRKRVEKLFMCSHLIFGKIEENGSPTPEQAFKSGMDYAAKH